MTLDTLFQIIVLYGIWLGVLTGLVLRRRGK